MLAGARHRLEIRGCRSAAEMRAGRRPSRGKAARYYPALFHKIAAAYRYPNTVRSQNRLPSHGTLEGTMPHDSQLQQAVLAALRWEPSVVAAHIGVAAKAGVVTLTGTRQ